MLICPSINLNTVPVRDGSSDKMTGHNELTEMGLIKFIPFTMFSLI